MSGTLESEHTLIPWTAFVTLDHIGVVRLRQLTDAIHAFQGSCHFILGYYAPDMFWQLTVPSVLYASLNVPTVCSQRGVPIITMGYLKSRENGNPGVPIFTGCVYFHGTITRELITKVNYAIFSCPVDAYISLALSRTAPSKKQERVGFNRTRTPFCEY